MPWWVCIWVGGEERSVRDGVEGGGDKERYENGNAEVKEVRNAKEEDDLRGRNE